MIKCSKFLYKYCILYTVSNKKIAMQRRSYLKFYNFDIAFIHIIIVRFLLKIAMHIIKFFKLALTFPLDSQYCAYLNVGTIFKISHF